uniref:Uncharacterized protein n=1 Tax=Romanomermis culicivorax TaxID=13658 RepID=A0A915JHM4_ROMCU
MAERFWSTQKPTDDGTFHRKSGVSCDVADIRQILFMKQNIMDENANFDPMILNYQYWQERSLCERRLPHRPSVPVDGDQDADFNNNDNNFFERSTSKFRSVNLKNQYFILQKSVKSPKFDRKNGQQQPDGEEHFGTNDVDVAAPPNADTKNRHGCFHVGYCGLRYSPVSPLSPAYDYATLNSSEKKSVTGRNSNNGMVESSSKMPWIFSGAIDSLWRLNNDELIN